MFYTVLKNKNKRSMCKNMYIIILQLTWPRNWIFYEENADVGIFFTAIGRIFIISRSILLLNELCQVLLKSKYFVKSYETFPLFNLASVVSVKPCVILSSRKTYCHVIDWSTKKKSLLERSKELKKPYAKNYILRWSSSQNMPGLCKQTFRKRHGKIIQEFLGYRMRNSQGVIFI